jgi:hypothetical protein
VGGLLGVSGRCVCGRQGNHQAHNEKLLALASSGDYESEGYLVPQVVA